jgi:hypothetical protein
MTWWLGRQWFLLRAKIAELRMQILLWRSGLGQPGDREIGDDL